MTMTNITNIAIIIKNLSYTESIAMWKSSALSIIFLLITDLTTEIDAQWL